MIKPLNNTYYILIFGSCHLQPEDARTTNTLLEINHIFINLM
jgi:hypothetical protein